MRFLVYAILALTSTLSEAKAYTFSKLLDKPLSLTVLPLSEYGQASSKKGSWYFTLSCHYYPKFMVKEIMADGKGAAKISISPSTPENPASCTPTTPKERVLSQTFFLGMKGDFLFFTEADYHNGADGITILNTEGFRVFQDTRGKLLENRTPSEITIENKDTLTLHYTRFFEAPCSLFGKSKEECWDKVKKDTGLQGEMPRCSLPDDADYQSKEWQAYLEKVPTVVEYKVVARATGTTSTIQPEPALQKNIYCQPPDSN